MKGAVFCQPELGILSDSFNYWLIIHLQCFFQKFISIKGKAVEDLMPVYIEFIF